MECTVPYLRTFSNIVKDIDDKMAQIETLALEYESNESGRISTEDVDYYYDELENQAKKLEDPFFHAEEASKAALEYIEIKNLNKEEVDDSVNDCKKKLQKNVDKLDDLDKEIKNLIIESASQLEFRISIANVAKEYHDGTMINYKKAKDLEKESWFQNPKKSTIDKLLDVSKETLTREGGDDWGAAASGQVYVKGGVDVNKIKKSKSGKYNYDLDYDAVDIETTVKATDYFKGNIGFNAVSTDFSSEIDNGFTLDGKASLFEGHVAGQVGNHINVKAEGNMKVLEADGHAGAQWTDNNKEIGLEVGATAASVKGSIQSNIWSVDIRNKKGEKINKPLLGMKVGGGVGASIGAGAYVKSEAVKQGKYIDITANTIHIDAAAIAKVKIDITFPFFEFN